MRRYADESSGAQDAPGVFDREFFLPHVYSVGTAEHGQVGPVVHDEQRRSVLRNLSQQSGTLEQFAIGQLLVAQLQHRYAGIDQCLHLGLKLARGRTAIDQYVESSRGQTLETAARDVDSPFERVRAVAKLLDARRRRGSDGLGIFFQAAERLLDALEVRSEHRLESRAFQFLGQADACAHVGLCLACGMPLGR